MLSIKKISSVLVSRGYQIVAVDNSNVFAAKDNMVEVFFAASSKSFSGVNHKFSTILEAKTYLNKSMMQIA